MRRAVLLALVALALPASALAGPIEDYERSWTHRALGLQYQLSHDVPMRNAPWVGTHNSFNSRAEMGPSVSATDSNQSLTIVDQLRLDMRNIELDLHWFPSARAGGFVPVVCHATDPPANAGCTVEKEFSVVLDEILGWLATHRDQVLLLYLEDDLASEGFDPSARVLESKLGGLIYRTGGAAGQCVRLPLDLTRRRALRAGKRVIVVSNTCGMGTAWRSRIFQWAAEEEHVSGYRDFPGCDPRLSRATYDAKVIRFLESSTFVDRSTLDVGERITPQSAARLTRCGVDVVNFDQLVPDPRLDALVWSWAPAYPRANDRRGCAVQGLDARWRQLHCARRRRAACRSRTGSWSVTRRRVPAKRARRLCRRARRAHAVPRTGYEGQLLRVAMQRSGTRSAWLGYRRRGTRWVALDRR